MDEWALLSNVFAMCNFRSDVSRDSTVDQALPDTVTQGKKVLAAEQKLLHEIMVPWQHRFRDAQHSD